MSGFSTKSFLVFCTAFAFAALAADASSTPSALEAHESIDGTIIIPPRPPRQDQMSVRTETRLGTPQCHPEDTAPICLTGPWLETRSSQFVNIRKTTFLGNGARRLPLVPGTQMSSSFVAQEDATVVAIAFTAEAYVQPGAGTGKRLFVRALVDGLPVEPSNVVLATDGFGGTRSFTFTTKVDQGIHTVEMQWLVDRDATGLIRDATVLIQQGSSRPGRSTLTVQTPPSGPALSLSQPVWKDVSGLSTLFYATPSSIVTVSVSGETVITNDPTKRMFVRVLVDGLPITPGDVVFARGTRIQSRTMTFGISDLATGLHTVRAQWLVDAGATGLFGDRSLVVSAFSDSVASDRMFVAAPSGANQTTNSTAFTTVPDMFASVVVPSPGNGQLAVTFSAEMGVVPAGTAEVALALDGVLQPDTTVSFANSIDLAHVHDFVFDAKRLGPGPVEVEILWRVVDPGTEAILGDRTLSVIAEVGDIPDLAEAQPFGPGNHPPTGDDNLTRLEPVIGDKDVLTILWDPHRGSPHPDQTDMPINDVEDILFGAGDSADDYFREVSGGRFGLRNAGILGWYDALQPSSHYWSHPAGCTDGFESGHVEKWGEALTLADPDFDFSAYDKNNDGRVDPLELAIVIVIPQDTSFGTALRVPLAQQCPGEIAFFVDGVVITSVLEVYSDANAFDDEWVVFAHELSHQILGIDDMYTNDTAARPGRMTMMAVAAADKFTLMPHLGAPHKLALGWATPRTIDQDGVYNLGEVKTSEEVFVLPRYDNPDSEEEYFVLENRLADLPGVYDDDIGDSGVGVWHVVGDRLRNNDEPRGVSVASWSAVPNTQARRGIRLVRPWFLIDYETGDAILPAGQKNNALWDGLEDYDLLSGGCALFPDNTLTWADCTSSGYGIRFNFQPAQPLVPLEIDVP
jgi:M6 family metalloprotease-like protein